jgi:hypothetical protein
VVNRRPQESHSRRRRMASPSSAGRESTTLVSVWPHQGQITTPHLGPSKAEPQDVGPPSLLRYPSTDPVE